MRTIRSGRTIRARSGESPRAIRSTALAAARTIRSRRAGELRRPRRAIEGDRAVLMRGTIAILRRPGSLAPQVLGKASPLLVARDLEAIPRILVLAAGTPIARTPIAGRGTCRPSPGERLGPLLILRLPQSPAREPLHHRIGMSHLQLAQRGQEFFFCVGAKCGGLPFEDDRPVVVPGGHGFADYGSFGIAACGSRRLSFSMSVVRFRLSSFAA